MIVNCRTRLEEDIETGDIADETVELLQEDIKSPLFGGQQFIIPEQLDKQVFVLSIFLIPAAVE